MAHLQIISVFSRYRSVTSQLKRIARCCATFPNLISINELEKRLHDLPGAQKNNWGNGGTQSEISKLYTEQCIEMKSMKNSYQEACIPLRSQPIVREKYVNFNGHDTTIRIGRLLENLDSFAVWICSQHNKRTGQKESPLVFVTSSVDRIALDNVQISPSYDIKMVGNIIHTGNTSMQVSMKLMQMQDGDMQKKLHAVFVMVARDPDNTRSVGVNQVKAETPEEIAILKKADSDIQMRKQQDRQSLLKLAPNPEESALVHKIFKDSLSKTTLSFSNRVKPDNMVWMEDAKRRNIFVCFPEQRNMYNKIFGGFLMRRAIEIAYATAIVHSKSTVIFRCIDNIKFEHPVEVGSLLYMSSQIAYTKREFMQVRVHAEVINPKTSDHRATNSFNFTVAAKTAVNPVIPKTYGESMMFLDGRRHFKEFQKA